MPGVFHLADVRLPLLDHRRVLNDKGLRRRNFKRARSLAKLKQDKIRSFSRKDWARLRCDDVTDAIYPFCFVATRT